MTCDPRLPWDEALGACMSGKSITEFTCRLDARGFLNKVSFVSGDGTVVESSTAAAAAGDTEIKHTLAAGEKLNRALWTWRTAIKYKTLAGGHTAVANTDRFWDQC